MNGNQLQYNVTDMVMIAFDYATLGLQQEEKLFISNYQYEHREKHLKQHLVVFIEWLIRIGISSKDKSIKRSNSFRRFINHNSKSNNIESNE